MGLKWASLPNLKQLLNLVHSAEVKMSSQSQVFLTVCGRPYCVVCRGKSVQSCCLISGQLLRTLTFSSWNGFLVPWVTCIIDYCSVLNHQSAWSLWSFFLTLLVYVPLDKHGLTWSLPPPLNTQHDQCACFAGLITLLAIMLCSCVPSPYYLIGTTPQQGLTRVRQLARSMHARCSSNVSALLPSSQILWQSGTASTSFPSQVHSIPHHLGHSGRQARPCNFTTCKSGPRDWTGMWSEAQSRTRPGVVQCFRKGKVEGKGVVQTPNPQTPNPQTNQSLETSSFPTPHVTLSPDISLSPVSE